MEQPVAVEGDREGNVSPIAALLLAPAAFFLAFDLSIAATAHALFSSYIDLGYLLLHPFSGLALAAILLYPRSGRRFLLLPVGLLLLGAIASSISSPHSSSITALRYIWFGLVSIAVGAALVRQQTRVVLFAVVLGISAWAVVSLIVYIFSVLQLADKYPWLLSYRIDELIVAMRFPGEEQLSQVLYDEVIGNMNQAANRCILAVILLGLLFVTNQVRMRYAILVYVPVFLLLLVSFSRGALLVGFVLGIGGFLGVWILRRKTEATAWVPLWVALILPGVLSFAPPALRDRWVDLTTVESRIDQWSAEIVDQWSAEIGERVAGNDDARPWLERFVMGYGPGGYGLARFGSVDAGTHNIFLDVWFSAGVIGLIGLVLLLYRACARALVDFFKEARNQTCLASLLGLAAVVVLGIREYPLAYLYASGMEGVLLGMFAGLAFLATDNREKRRAPTKSADLR